MSKRNAGHRGVSRGKRVLIIFRDGHKEVDRFIDFRDRYYVFERIGKIGVRSVSSMGIYKGG